MVVSVRRHLSVATLALVFALALAGTADGASWHLNSEFGRGGVAGLALREGSSGTLMAAGPKGSTFVGGYAKSRPGSFLVSLMSARGTLVKSFGTGGLIVIPVVYVSASLPPRIFALKGGRLLILGLSRTDQLVAVRLGSNGRLDHTFGRRGVAQLPLAGVPRPAGILAATVEANGDILAVYEHEIRVAPNEPAIRYGQGTGSPHMIRLLPSGALDRSFGSAGYLTGAEPPALRGGGPGPNGESGVGCVGAAPDGSISLAYGAVVDTAVGNAVPEDEVPAVQRLDASGAGLRQFGTNGTLMPAEVGEPCQIFSLPGSEVEVVFGTTSNDVEEIPTEAPPGGVGVVRFTNSGFDPAFAGTTPFRELAAPVATVTVGASGETVAVGRSGKTLTLRALTTTGALDPAFGGAHGLRLRLGLPAGEQSVELLAGTAHLTVRVGASLVQLSI